MPLYEYRCPEGDEVSVFHGVDERPDVRCPACGMPAERVFSPPMIHTKYYFSSQIKSHRRAKWKPPDDAEQSKPEAGTPEASKPSGAGDGDG
jgi:putative FmdB family regulatory protein